MSLTSEEEAICGTCIHRTTGKCDTWCDHGELYEPKTLKKDSGCVFCEHIFDCKGKPPTVKLCVNFKERKRMHND